LLDAKERTAMHHALHQVLTTLAALRADFGLRRRLGLALVTDRSFVVASFTRISTISWNTQSRGRSIMNFGSKFAMTLVGAAISASMCSADTLPAHRIPAALAIEAASETIAACARQGYRETAVVLDSDGATIVAVRGDGAGIHTLDSAHDKAYTSVSFKNDTIALAERAKGEDSIAPLAKLPHVMFFGGGIVIKLGDETIGAIGASGAPGAKLDDNCARAGLEKIRDRLK
jgi:uncharacterized protein GlcG (DUF336 family)